MNFDYSKLTALHMLDFYLLAMKGQWGFSAGTLILVAKTGVDLTTVPASETAKLADDFWQGFTKHTKQASLERLFKGEKDNDQQKA